MSAEILDLIANPDAVPQPGQYIRTRQKSAIVVKKYYAPTDNSAEIALANFRSERERLFAATEWIRQRHTDRMEMDLVDSANWSMWLEYWQALRDLPNAPDFDPANVQWPEMPE